jgi:ABC-type molybdate transport system permease subunit
MDERARYLESEEAQVQNRERVVSHKEQQLTAALVQLPVLRENLRGALQTLDESLARLAETGRSQPESRLLGQDAD